MIYVLYAGLTGVFLAAAAYAEWRDRRSVSGPRGTERVIARLDSEHRP